MTIRNSAIVQCIPRGNTAMGRVLLGIFFLSLTGFLAVVDSFSPLSYATTIRKANHLVFDSSQDYSHFGQRERTSTHFFRETQQQQRQKSSAIVLRSGEKDTNDSGDGGVLNSIGLVSQPIVWISLYSLATTGHGLPAGPGGAIGALEGIAYLVVVVLAVLPTDSGSLARTLSRTSIALGLLVLAGVAFGKGCVPNAKPILDYSAYLPVCGPE